MARMIPTEPDVDAPKAERYVFGRLRERLPQAWTVLHARRFFLPAREGRRAEEGEVDFVVIDPERGIVALEVKGGEVSRTPDGWTQKGADGVARSMKDPGKQVQGAVRSLDRYLRAQPWFERTRKRIRFAWGVVLPDVDVRGALGPDLPRELVIARQDFADLRGAIGRIFAASGREGPALGDDGAAAIIRALAPTLRLIRPLAARIDQEGEALVRLTQEQARILDALSGMPRVAIEGAAGTGKTMLAMEWAERLAREGQRVMLLCFNRLLADFLAKQASGRFGVMNFHRACHDLCQGAGVSFEVPAQGRGQREFWDHDAPLLMLEALEKLPQLRWDAIVVDEGQDFRPDWWPAIEGMLRVPGAGRLVVFFDPNQEIFGGGPAKGLEVSPAKLRWNCRNTGHIARFAHAVIGSEAELRPGAPEGVAVELSDVRGDGEAVDEVRRHLHRLLGEEGLRPDQIVVLSTRGRDRSALANAGRLGNVRLCPIDAEPGPGQVRFGSLHQFKGLEADAVILVDVRPGEPNSSPRHVYVASSRARHLLIVIQLVDG
jgi:hypothetical protein